jgi:RHS repeat-associated protein
VHTAPIEGLRVPAWGAHIPYDPEADPLRAPPPEPEPPRAIFYYHTDHLGTPQLLTDAAGQQALEMEYQAWGAAREILTQAAQSAGLRNPLRFQGQYHDDESGLHYNRYRYYDPDTGRFISRDPIGLLGGMNVHAYAPNPVEWVDPLGLARIYKDAPYHGVKDTGVKSKAPLNGPGALDNSVQVKESSPRRVGVDPENGDIVVMDKTRTHNNGDEEFHGHVRCWCDLHNDQQAALKKSGLVNLKGKRVK